MRLELTSGQAATCFQDKLLIQPDDLRIKKFRGLESNQRLPGSEPGVTTSSNCPGSCVLGTQPSRPKFGEKDLNLHNLLQRQVAYL